MSLKRNLIAGATLALLLVGQASAYATKDYNGVDANGDPFTPLDKIPNASAAETNFKTSLLASSLVDVVGTENFELQNVGSATELSLVLGGAGTATLKASAGAVAQVAVGDTNGFGRYSVPGGTKFWDTQAGGAGSFNVLFDRDMAGFGFYGIDIGDLTGTLTLVMYDEKDQEISRLDVPTASTPTDADGSVLYFGFIAQNSKEFFRRISFSTSSNLVDGFGFDSFTMGSARLQQIPEPGTLALVAAAMLGLRLRSQGRRS